MEVRDVPIAKIRVSANRRSATPARVQSLVESIREIGLQHPIGVVPEDNGYRLVHGRHRLMAFSAMGRLEIPCIVMDLDAVLAELAELDENLCRTQLTKLQEGQALKRRKEIYEALHPETRKGVAGGKTGGRGREKIASDNLSFANDTAAKTGKSKRTVERAVAAAQNITEEVQQLIDNTPVANNQSQLNTLAELPSEEQLEVAESMVAAVSKPKAKRKKTAKKKTTQKHKADAAVLTTDDAVRDIVWSWATCKGKAIAAAILENWAIEIRESV